MTLPTKLYETLRWILYIVAPAALTLVASLNTILNLNLNMELITLLVGAFTTFIGAVTGVAKVSYDKELKAESK
ncbi:hypothetical protein IJG14_01660 [bacterium]|nr:hypothetical protein [bacterium]